MEPTSDNGLDSALPAAQSVVLGRNALEVALVEVRFDSNVDTLTASQGLSIGDALRRAGIDVPAQQPIAEQTLTVNFESTGASHEVENRASGWRYASADQTLVVTIQPGLLSVQTNRYERWSESLCPPLEIACHAVAEVISPQLVNRIGLRYINRFIDSAAANPAAWSGRIDSHLLGVVEHAQLGNRLAGAQQQFEVGLGEARAAVVRHGVFRDGATGGSFNYLLDLDVFDTQAAPFDPVAVCGRATALNRAALALFREMITDQYFESQLDARVVPETDAEVGR